MIAKDKLPITQIQAFPLSFDAKFTQMLYLVPSLSLSLTQYWHIRPPHTIAKQNLPSIGFDWTNIQNREQSDHICANESIDREQNVI